MSDVPADVQATGTLVGEPRADSVFSGTSEYASQYATVSTEAPAVVAAVEDARPAGLPPAKAAPVSFSSSVDAAAGEQADRFVSEYSAWTAVARENARPSSRIATAAAEAAQTRTAKRRGSIAAQEAAEVAQRRQAEQQAAAAEHDFPEAAELKRRVSSWRRLPRPRPPRWSQTQKKRYLIVFHRGLRACGLVVLGEDNCLEQLLSLRVRRPHSRRRPT